MVIEDTGPGSSSSSSDSAPSATPIESNGQVTSTTDDRDEDYSFLNGEESPFFQPPGSDDGSATEY